MRYIDSFRRLVKNQLPLRAHGPLDGMTLGNWVTLVRQHGLPKIGKTDNARLAIIACRNSIQTIRENRQAATSISGTDISNPVFILGYWRSGTTHLHNLFAADYRFAFPTQFDVNHPRTFMTTSLPRDPVAVRRVQDNVLSSDLSPDEDEYALLAMTAVTPYLSLLYPSLHRHFYRFLTFSNATPSELTSFKSALLLFHQRLASSYKKPIVYKSPGHTARIALLLEMFPNARFVHIHRDPVAVYQSKIHLLNSMFGNRITDDEKHQLVVDTYAHCYEAYMKDLPLIPEGHIAQVTFNELETEPLDAMRRIYSELQLPDFSVAENAMQQYLQGQSSYRKNAYANVSDDVRLELRAVWGEHSRALGYNI